MKFTIGPVLPERPVRAELVMSRWGRPQLLLDGCKVLEISEEGLLNRYRISETLKASGIKTNPEGWIKDYSEID